MALTAEQKAALDAAFSSPQVYKSSGGRDAVLNTLFSSSPSQKTIATKDQSIEEMKRGYTNPESADKFWENILPKSVYTASKTFKDYVAEPISKGVVKGVAGIGESALNIADKGVEFFGGDLIKDKTKEKILAFTKPETTGQAVVKGITQGLIGGSAGAKVGSKIASTAVKYLSGGSNAAKTAGSVLGFGAKSAGATAGVTGASEGRLPTAKELAFGAAIDALTAGISKFIDPQRLKQKAMGVSPQVNEKLSKIVKSVKKNGEPIYDNLEDFAIKNKITGSRPEMIDRAEELYRQATASKKNILKSVSQGTTRNELASIYGDSGSIDDLFSYLQSKYSSPGNKALLKEINELGKKASFTAENIDRIRYLADKTLPKSAYAGVAGLGAEPVQVEGIERLINPLRRRLEILDKTGEIAKANLHKRLLNPVTAMPSRSLTKALEQASKKSVFQNAITTGALSGASTIGATSLPVVGPLIGKAAAVVGGLEVLTSIPQIASLLGDLNKGGRAGAAAKDQLGPILKGIISEYQKSQKRTQKK